MLKGCALLLLSVAVAHANYAHQQLSGLTTYEMMPDVTTDEMLTDVIEEEPSEEPSNKIIPDEHDLHEYRDDLEEFLEVTAKCGYTSNGKETTLGSVSWNAKHEEIAQNIRLFTKTCESLRREARILDSEWTNYKTKHAKSYESPEEDSVRRELYFKRKADIEAHNLLYSKGLTSYSMGLNHFSDMRLEEMGRMLGGAEEGYGLNITFPNMEVYVPSNLTLPQSADWRRKGAVTPVKNQGHCGSCWAFSTTGGIEGQWKIHHGQLPSLSEQQLVDCSHSNPNHGCHGGNVIIALNDIQRSGGIESEQAYPYYSGSGHEGYCRFDRRRVAATVNGYVMIPSGNEGALQDAVANQGPVSVMIHVSERFYHYRNGVFDDPPCVSTGNHAILAVGYGVQYGRPYWLVKNSWGPGWGFQGFGLMSRNRGNQCIIATFANYPRV